MKHSGLFFIFKFLSSLLAIVVLAVFFTGTGQAQDMKVPEDFELTLFSAPVKKGAQPGPHGVTIQRNNTAIFFTENPQGERIPGQTMDLDEGAVQALYRVVREQRFFELKNFYENPRVLDGDYAVLTVTAGGQTHSVKTRNIKLEPFDTIALWVNSYFEPENMIIYNAFIGGEMEEAER